MLKLPANTPFIGRKVWMPSLIASNNISMITPNIFKWDLDDYWITCSINLPPPLILFVLQSLGGFHCRQNIKRSAIFEQPPNINERCLTPGPVNFENIKRLICCLYAIFKCTCTFKFPTAIGCPFTYATAAYFWSMSVASFYITKSTTIATLN